MSRAATYNFSVQTGADFTRVFAKTANGVAVNMTGLKVRAQFRALAGATGTTTSTTLLLSLANAAGIAITNAAGGEITLTLTNAQTATLNPRNIRMQVAYGIEIYYDAVSPNVVTPFLQGTVTLYPEVVR